MKGSIYLQQTRPPAAQANNRQHECERALSIVAAEAFRDGPPSLWPLSGDLFSLNLVGLDLVSPACLTINWL